MTLQTRVASLALVMLLAGCAGDPSGPPIAQVNVTPNQATVSIGQSVQLFVAVLVVPHIDYTVVWSSADTTVATVDSTGLVTGIAASPGVSICAQAVTRNVASNLRGCAPVTVTPASCVGPSGSLVPVADTVHVGDVAHFQIPAAQLAGRDASLIRWTRENAAVAGIDSLSGAVTALNIGTATVVATDRSQVSPCPRDWRAVVVVR